MVSERTGGSDLEFAVHEGDGVVPVLGLVEGANGEEEGESECGGDGEAWCAGDLEDGEDGDGNEADGGEVGEAVGVGLGEDLYEADHGEEGDEVPEPACERRGKSVCGGVMVAAEMRRSAASAAMSWNWRWG